jgi:lipopolysaccharide exporter
MNGLEQDLASRSAKAYSSARWTALSSFLRAGLRVLQIMIVARLLAPEEFGHFVMALAILALAGPLANLGFGRSLVHHRDIPDETLSSLYWANLFASMLVAALVLALSPIAGWAFEDRTLAHVLALCSPQFVLAAVGQQFRTLAAKEHRFSELAKNEIGAVLVSFLATVVLAFLGFGVYSLVVGALSHQAVSSLAAWIWLSRDRRPSLHFRLDEARPHFGYGAYVVGQQLVGVLHRRTDLFAGGWLAGPESMGIYGVPRNLSMRLASAVVNPVINRIGFPRMSEMQGDLPRLRRYFLASLQLTAALNYPIYILLAMYAHEFVLFMYGPNWQGAEFFLRLFCAVALLRSVGNPAALVFAVGHVRKVWFWHLGQLILVPPSLILAGLSYGLPGLAWCMLVIQLMLVVPRWAWLVRPACNASLFEYLKPIAVPLGLCLLAMPLTWLATSITDHAFARLALGTIVFGTLYMSMSYLFNRPLLEALARFAGLKLFQTSNDATRPQL